MKKKWIAFLWSLIILMIFLSGCRASNENMVTSSGSAKSTSTDESASMSENAPSSSFSSNTTLNSKSSNNTNLPSDLTIQKRMVIYHADYSVTVTKLSDFQKEIEAQTKQYNGYVLAMSQNQANDHLQTSITLRIPEKAFYSFLKIVEDDSGKVLHKSIQGQDVTKQYIDLSSRLKAKELVKARLTEYLNKATTTEDLLNISDQLGKVQEAIEQIQGQMHYYKNQSDLSTITINATEQANPKIDTTHLNTWEKSKSLFKSSINGLVSFLSELTVFLIGFSPILILLIIIGTVLYFLYKKRKKRFNDK